jgi:predicted  nucleic acid-binding Zn-ribbon protein
MEFQVNTNNVILSQINQAESGEYNVTECKFNFSSEYNGLTKIAVFTGANGEGDAYKLTILNNKCEIPTELLAETQIVQIGVYAYDVDGTELVLRYSPMPTKFFIHKGSFVVNAVNMSKPTATEVEQLQSQITHNRNDIDELEETYEQYGTDINELKGEVAEIKTEQTEQNTNIQKNTDDIVEINQNISAINTDIGDLEQDINVINQNIDDLEQDLTNYSLIAETGSQIELQINTTTFKFKSILKDKNGNVIFTSNEIDLPLESFIVSATYDNTTKEIVLTLQNGQTLRFSVADLVSGLVSETQLQTILTNYYTKAQVDNLLSAKANQSSLNQTNQNVTNLTGRVSTNEEDIADIKEEQTTQNTNIEELQTQVETLQEDLDNAEAEIAELNTDITNMRKAMITVEGQGSDITLPNTSENKFVEFGLEGRTEQDGEPTSETAVPIKNVTGNANVKIQNKNLQSGEQLYTKMYDYNSSYVSKVTVDNKECIRFMNSQYTKLNILEKYKENTQYTILGDFKWGAGNNGNLSIGIVYTDNTSTSKSITDFSNWNKIKLTSTPDKTIKSIHFSYGISCVWLLDINSWLIAEGNVDNYVPHQEQNYPFTFAEGQRGMQGTTLEDDGIHQKRKQKIFDGTENWYQYGDNIALENWDDRLTPTHAYTALQGYKCNIAIETNVMSKTLNNNTFATNNLSNVDWIVFHINMSVTDWKAYLAEQYANGTPVIVEYKLAESELENNIIPYNSTQQEQYNAIKQARSYDDQTSITSTSDELGFNMNVVAVANANKVINTQNNEIDTIKSRLDLLEG